MECLVLNSRIRFLEISNYDENEKELRIYRGILTSYEWASLTDEEKGQFISIAAAMASNHNEVCISTDPSVCKKQCALENEPPIDKFIKLNLFEVVTL